MDNWTTSPPQLDGELVTLIAMEERHFRELTILAKEKRIWEFYIFDGTDTATFTRFLQAGIDDRKKGIQFPFVIFLKTEQKLIGSTRFLDIQEKHKKLEIGSTWLHPDYWATAVNLECKLLLLTYAFEQMNASRVQLKTDENNIRSGKAIEKIGGRFEGILRNDMIRDNNTKRNSAYFSIIEEEWLHKKKALQELYLAKKSRD